MPQVPWSTSHLHLGNQKPRFSAPYLPVQKPAGRSSGLQRVAWMAVCQIQAYGHVMWREAEILALPQAVATFPSVFMGHDSPRLINDGLNALATDMFAHPQ